MKRNAEALGGKNVAHDTVKREEVREIDSSV